MKSIEVLGAAAAGVCAYVAACKAYDAYKVSANKSQTIKLGYWGIRGLAAPLRMMLEYTGASYEQTVYTDGDPWFKVKKPELKAKNALANLPYLEMPDGTVVCESNACYAHLASYLGLVPTSADMAIKNDELLSLAKCTRDDMTNRCYNKRWLPDRAAFDGAMTKLLGGGPFDKYEGSLKLSGTPFFCGAGPCACDFHIFEMMDQYLKLANDLNVPSPLASLPLCSAFYERFKALPTLQAYFASADHKRRCNAPSAHWG